MATERITLQPRIVDLYLYAGDDAFLDVVVTDTTGAAVDLTGANARAQIRSDPSSGEVLASFAVTVENDTVHLHLAGNDAARLPAASVWDVQVSDDAGTVRTLVSGMVSMTPEVTR